MELVPNFPVLGRVRGRRPGITYVLLQRIDRPSRSRRHLIESPIYDDPRQPGPEWPSEIEAVDVLERGEESVLNEILRVLTVAHEPHRQRHRPREVSLDDTAKRITLTDQNASEKLAVLIGRPVRAKHERCA